MFISLSVPKSLRRNHFERQLEKSSQSAIVYKNEKEITVVPKNKVTSVLKRIIDFINVAQGATENVFETLN